MKMIIHALIPLLAMGNAAASVAADRAGQTSFSRDVRPILSEHCFACHGFDESSREADLRLDIAEAATEDRGGMQAISPGKPQESEVWRRITAADPDEVMPPPSFDKSLSDEQKEILQRWIEEGAEYESHWSFVAPVKPSVPDVPGAENSIDAFLQARLQAEGLTPAAEASKETLIRRVTLDLTGLPPTLDEVDEFLADTSRDAYERLIDRLQSRPSYGEHMGRYWLDLARYADTHGLHLDNERSMWPYRDWVVRAINQNVPFDEFTRWQLAGDLLADPTEDQLIASGFNRCNVTTSEGGSIQEEWIYRYAVDRTTTMAEVWMGLTAGCAVCHDHKFDPLTTKEYYSTYAFFHSAADPAMDGNIADTPPVLKLIPDEDKARTALLDREIAAIDERIDTALANFNYTDPATLEEPPPLLTTEEIWFEDAFPSAAQPQGGSLTLVKKPEGEVFSGAAALQRKATNEVAQNYFAGGAEFVVPPNGRFFVHCYLDPHDPPVAIMVQFHTDAWNNRAVWGAEEKIPFGRANTNEKVVMGPLPRTGEWVKLEFDAARIGLAAGAKVSGYAFTQFAGTVTWDRLGIVSRANPATDPAWSWQVWSRQPERERRKVLPDDLRRQLQGRNADRWTVAETQRLRRFWLRHIYAGARELVEPLEAEKTPLEKEKSEIEKAAPVTLVMADLPKPRDSFVMKRGAYDRPGDKVTRNVPSFLPALPDKPEGVDYDRLDLADWLVSDQHPLTARVTVNRFWQQFFGTGLVKTSEDFGTQGELPSHPELLDWLAMQFQEDGWDMKRLVRRIVTSHAYRQSSQATPELVQRDPENRLLARGPRFRLDAEVLRDQALFVSGLLVPAIGGEGVKPYQPPNIWEPVGFGRSNTRYYQQDSGAALYRRSLYTFLKRTAPPPFMASFDAPNREQSCARRGRSNTPMQALQLMNDVQHIEAARNFAERIVKEGGSSDDNRIVWAWRTVTARRPDSEERAILCDALQQHRQRYAADQNAAAELVAYGESEADPELDKAELAAWTLVANLILNLDESVSKN